MFKCKLIVPVADSSTEGLIVKINDIDETQELIDISREGGIKMIDKIEKTKSALENCLHDSCYYCPYINEPDCKRKIYADSIDVIKWLQDKLMKKGENK